jgi:hypothetical protein
VALYAHQLPTHLGIEAYATFLNSIRPHIAHLTEQESNLIHSEYDN